MFTGTQNIDYFSTRALSNSLMKIYCDDFNQFVNYWIYKNPLKIIKSDQLKFGSLSDTLITSRETFESRYSIFSGTVPTGQMAKYIEALIDNNNDPIKAYNVVKEDNGGKLRDTIDKFQLGFDKFKDYHRAISDSTKEIIPKSWVEKAETMITEVRTNPRTRVLANAVSGNGIEVFHQVEIYITIKGIKCKCAIDKVIVDHNKRRIIIIDYKTSSNAINFTHSVNEYGYYRQGSFYLEMITYWMKDKGISDYEIMDFLFLVMSSTRKDHHFVFRYNNDDSIIARNGGYLHNGIYVKGWEEILNEINYLTELKDWRFPYEIAQSQVINLDIFKK